MKKSLITAAVWLLAASPSSSNPSDEENGDGWLDAFPLASYTLLSTGENPYFSLKPGHFVVLGELERKRTSFVMITVLDETETVDGTETRVVEEREFQDGKLKEVSRNFFAMAKESNDVFYFGEDVDDYADGAVVGHSGAWRVGRDGARAGLMMPGTPVTGMKYYQEMLPGKAMDRAEIVRTNATVETPVGSFENCLIVTESSPLEPGDESYKRYAPGIGMIFDDGLELLKHGWRDASERMIEIEIEEGEMPRTPAEVVRKLHPTGEVREVKVELHPSRVVYAVETFVGGQQHDVEVTENGVVLRNERD